jgi:hypothetical protein
MIYPIALEAVQRLDALFDLERAINGQPAAERVAMRQQHSRPLVDELHIWLTAQLIKLSRSHDLAKACQYMLRRCDAAMLRCLHPLPRRWPHLPDQQRRRTGASLRAAGPQGLAVLRF